ncbi:high mobility group box domain-containing protein, partial [Gongronella butleri]
PKRPLSAYMFYSMMVREKVKNDNPDATFGQIGNLIGEQWKALSDAEKQYYVDRSVGDLERYQRESKFYD